MGVTQTGGNDPGVSSVDIVRDTPTHTQTLTHTQTFCRQISSFRLFFRILTRETVLLLCCCCVGTEQCSWTMCQHSIGSSSHIHQSSPDLYDVTSVISDVTAGRRIAADAVYCCPSGDMSGRRTRKCELSCSTILERVRKENG